MKKRLAIFMLGLVLLGAVETATAQGTAATYDIQFHGVSGASQTAATVAGATESTLARAYTVNPAGQIGGNVPGPQGWTALGSGLLGSSVNALVKVGTNLVAGGAFTKAGGVTATNVALWSGTAWTGLGSGLKGTVRALAYDGMNVYAGGDFTNAGSMVTHHVALWNGTAWTGLGSGLDGTVRALVCVGTNLIAGGDFTNAGAVAASHLALWNGMTWTGLGSGVNGTVCALAWDGTNLIAGGTFTTAGGMAANRVARWDGTAWTALGSGINGSVFALTQDGTNLVVGGDFTAAGGVAASRVARWDGAGWTGLGSGMDDFVMALAQDGTNLVAGGFFTTAGGVAAKYVAMWNGAAWTNFGSGMNGSVRALTYDGSSLIAGGSFTTAGGEPASRMAAWGPTMVEFSGVEPASGSLAGGYQVAISGVNLCDGSDVTNVTLCGISATIQSVSSTQIVVTAGTGVNPAHGDVRVWSASFGETVRSNAFTYLANQAITFAAVAPQPVAASVSLSAFSSSGLLVSFRVASGLGAIDGGGNLTFSAPGSVAIVASQAGDTVYCAAWDVTNRVCVYAVSPASGPLAGGNTVTVSIGDLGAITNVWAGDVKAAVQGADSNAFILLMPSFVTAGVKDLVVQTSDNGDFTLALAYTVNPAGQIGGISLGPNVWRALGGGLLGSAVYALAQGGTNLFAGGSFTIAGGVAANDAKWDGLDWTDLGGGMNDTVTALAYDGTNLYAGGYFTSAGGVAANYVAMWNGAVWQSLGSGLDGPVSALVCDGMYLYAGGSFTTAGGAAASRVARWDGTAWTGLGSGIVGSSVTALAHDGTSLCAGGTFTKAGGVAAANVARWNGTGWTGLGSGVNGTVYAFAQDGTNVIAGGSFTIAGGVTVNRVARWNGTGWTGFGSGMNDTVRALTYAGADLVAGGYFTSAGGVAANYVAMWNGAGWQNLDSGVSSWVRALTYDGTNLIAGGYFTTAGGVVANDVAVWGPTFIPHVSVASDSGFVSGGYTVVIGGANLCDGSDVTNVTLCGVTATIISQCATQIVVTAGTAAAAGLGDARVFSTSHGETVRVDAFTYVADIPPVWDPQVQADASFGIRSNQFGFTIIGSGNLTVVVEACTNLVTPVWSSVVTNIFSDGAFYFSDPNWTNYPTRFYRLRQP